MNIENDSTTMELATEMTIAWLSNPNTRADAADASGFLMRMKAALDSRHVAEVGVEPESAIERPQAAVSVRRSLASRDYLFSMIDGKPYKTLRRHLSNHGMTPADYRERYGLKSDYPMVAESYSEKRRAMAYRIGLGRKPVAVDAAEVAETLTTSRRGRKSAAAGA